MRRLSFSASAALLIAVNATVLSIFWARLTPVLSAPGEAAHFDRILALARGQWGGEHTFVPTTIFQNDDVAAVVTATDADELSRDETRRVSRAYGTEEYFGNLDKIALSARHIATSDENPGKWHGSITSYDAFAALILRGCALLTPSFSAQFYSLRIIGCIMFGIVLLLSYSLLLRIGLPETQSLVSVAILSFIPIMGSGSSTIQPFTFLSMLISTTWLVALAVPYKRNEMYRMLIIGILLVIIGLTSQLFLIATSVSILPYLFVTARERVCKQAVIAIAAAALVWITFSYSHLLGDLTQTTQALGGDAGSSNGAHATQLQSIASLFLGLTSPSGPLLLGVPAIDSAIQSFILALFVTQMILIVRWLGASIEAVRRQWPIDHSEAIGMLVSNPLTVAYLVLTIVLLFIALRDPEASSPLLTIPILLPMVVISTHAAIARLASHKLNIAVVAFAFCVSIAACLIAPQSAYARFYAPVPSRQPQIPLDRFPYALSESQTLADIDQIVALGIPPGPSTFQRGNQLSVSGWAVDSLDAAPPRAVYVSIDDHVFIKAAFGELRPDVAAALQNEIFAHSGFRADFDTTDLSTGAHKLSIRVVRPDGTIALRSTVSKGFALQ